ncbi:MAG: hypothetical protein HY544_03495 [Candidatus Diapherotrites archaeon]|uniref:Uncharacterized protein n=1 Tax=Candidatus Iainarchaeum sp. TaxID=3101447 RepID=A0A8T3YJX2_9ARCH|nr:hypothetical protein [Candidatus Diapherotrites archaeon]
MRFAVLGILLALALVLSGCGGLGQDITSKVDISVYDSDGNPIQGAAVKAYSNYRLGTGANDKWLNIEGTISATDTTDAKGNGDVQIAPLLIYAITAAKDGYETNGIEKQIITGTNNISITLKKTSETPSPPGGGGSGPQTLTLYDGKGYPYDPTSTANSFPYKVTITTSGNFLQKIRIANDTDKWTTDTTSLGPLYPQLTGQSLTGHAATKAVFGQSLPDGTPGKGYASVTFEGFTGKEARTNILIGKAPDILNGLDGSARQHGGIKFYGKDDALHYLPFAIKESSTTPTGSATPSRNSGSFTFDGKTIYWNQSFGSTGSGKGDLQFTVNSGDYVNGRVWNVASNQVSGQAYLEVVGVDTFPLASSNSGIQRRITIDGVTYDVMLDSATAFKLRVSVDGEIILTKIAPYNASQSMATQNASLIYNKAGDITDDSYGKLYFTQDSVVTAPVGLSGTSDNRKFYYAVAPRTSLNSLWFLMAADTLGSSEGDQIQYGKTLKFFGTDVTENKTIDMGYYVPQSSDFATGPEYSSSNAYFVAQFGFDDEIDIIERGYTRRSSLMNFYIDTRDGGNIGPFQNVNLEGYSTDGVDEHLELISGTNKANLQAAYKDVGTKFSLLGNDNGISISSPENAENVELYVKDAGGNVKVFETALKSFSGYNPEIFTANDSDVMTNTQLPNLFSATVNEKVNGKSTTPIIQEKLGVTADAGFYIAKDVKDLAATIDGGNFYYESIINGSTGLDLGTTNYTASGDDDARIVLFGEQYRIKSAQLSGTRSIVLEKVASSPTLPKPAIPEPTNIQDKPPSVTASANISATTDDRAGTAGVFAANNSPDSKINVTMQIEGAPVTIKSIGLEKTNSTAKWSTANPANWPIIVDDGKNPLNTEYGKTFGPYGVGTQRLSLYINNIPGETFIEGKVTIEFMDGKIVTATAVPAQANTPGDKVCAQVVTYATAPNGTCKSYPTPCDVPTGHTKVDKCPSPAAQETYIGTYTKKKGDTLGSSLPDIEDTVVFGDITATTVQVTKNGTATIYKSNESFTVKRKSGKTYKATVTTNIKIGSEQAASVRVVELAQQTDASDYTAPPATTTVESRVFNKGTGSGTFSIQLKDTFTAEEITGSTVTIKMNGTSTTYKVNDRFTVEGTDGTTYTVQVFFFGTNSVGNSVAMQLMK